VIVAFGNSSTCQAVGAISGGVDLLAFLAGWLCMSASSKALSGFLGVKVRLTDSPTLRGESFVQWQLSHLVELTEDEPRHIDEGTPSLD
jgi:hypothetical protein